MNYNKIRNYQKFISMMKRLDEHEKFIFLYEYFYDVVKYNYLIWLYAELTYGCDKPISYCEQNYRINDFSNKELILFGISHATEFPNDSLFKPAKDDYLIFREILKARWEFDVYTLEGIREYKEHVMKLVSEHLMYEIGDFPKVRELITYFNEQIVANSFLPPYNENDILVYDIPFMIYKTYWSQKKFEDGVYHNGLIREGVCRHFTDFIDCVLGELDIKSVPIISQNGLFHAFNMVEFDNEIRFIDMTKEIYLRDGVVTGDYQKHDFYLCDIDTLFEMVPDRRILSIDNQKLAEVITKDNYRENISMLHESLNKKRTLSRE